MHVLLKHSTADEPSINHNDNLIVAEVSLKHCPQIYILRPYKNEDLKK